jgi:outer membrane protein assembly factor BamB
VKAGGRGDVTKSRVLGRYRKALPSTSSPLLYQGVLYLIRDGIFSSLDPETGEPFKVARLSRALGNYWSSAVAADGKIFVTSEEGKIVTLNADPQWEIVSITDVEEEIFATSAIIDGHIDRSERVRNEARYHARQRRRTGPGSQPKLMHEYRRRSTMP